LGGVVFRTGEDLVRLVTKCKGTIFSIKQLANPLWFLFILLKKPG